MTRIFYLDVPPGANRDYTVEGQAQPFWDGSLENAARQTPATLEPGEWPLDGSRVLTEEGQPMGFWSRTLSGEDGSFAQPVVVSLCFGQTYTASGLSLTFDEAGENYPTEFKVSWFRGGLRLGDETVRPAGGVVILNRVVEAFDRVELTFYRLNRPRHFLRLNRLVVGLETQFGPDELRDCRVYQETDILSTRLTGSTLEFTLSERKGRALRFQSRQPMEVWQEGRIVGRFYLKDSRKTWVNEYHISCVDAVGVLADSPCMGGMYHQVPFGRLVEEILAGQFEAEVHPDLAEEQLSGWLPAGSKRDALLQAAFAAGAMVTTVSGRLRFVPIPSYARRVETAREIFEGGIASEKPMVTSVTVTAHDYALGEERETVTERNVEAGPLTLRTNKPFGGYQVEGGTVLDSGANYLTLSAQGGPLKVTALPYRESCHSLTWVNPATSAADGENGLEIGQATLVDTARVGRVLARVREYAGFRQELKQRLVYHGQEPGELITSEKPFDGQLVGYITGMELNLAGKGVAEVTVIGKNVELEGQPAGFAGAIESGVSGWS